MLKAGTDNRTITRSAAATIIRGLPLIHHEGESPEDFSNRLREALATWILTAPGSQMTCRGVPQYGDATGLIVSHCPNCKGDKQP